jgi:hypothetical protein
MEDEWTYRDLLKNLVAARNGDYRSEPERMETIAHTFAWILEAVLEKLSAADDQ